MVAHLEALRPARHRSASWWDDADLEGAAGFSRGSARLQPACTRQAEFWEDAQPKADAPQASEADLGELFAVAAQAEPVAGPTAEEPAPPRSTVTFPSRGSYAERTQAQPAARTAPYLRLSGVLQTADREDSSFELPRARFRPRLRLGVERRRPLDSTGDVRTPAGGYAGGERLKFSGKIAL